MTHSLYPGKTREDLEFGYHWLVAALRLAAQTLIALGPPVADVDRAVRDKTEWLLDNSLDTAAKAGVVRAERNESDARARLAASKGKSKRPVFINLVLAAVALGPLRARAQRPVEFALDAADATIRALDAVSTHALLASPCRCFREDDPLAPHTAAFVPIAAFQAGIGAGTIEGSRRLAAHGHPRLGRLLLVADIAAETWAVQHNFRQHEPAPKAPGLTPTPNPKTVRIP